MLQRPAYMARIESSEPYFTEAEKKIARYLRGNAGEIIRLSITELSEITKTSDSSIIRFCRKLGYKGYHEMKLDIAQSMTSPTRQLHEDISERDSIKEIKEKIFSSASMTIMDTLSVLQDEQLEKAVKAITHARRIMFFGSGASAMVAMDAQHKFLKIGIPVMTYIDNHMQLMGSSMLNEQDVAIAISHSGANKDVIAAISLCKEAGATVIAITNFSKSPLTKKADINLFTSSKETKFRADATASRIAQLTIIDVLITGLALTDQSLYLKNFQQIRDATSTKRY